MNKQQPSTGENPGPGKRNSSGFFSDVIKLASGTTSALVIGLLATPFITRLFEPEAFGLMTLFLAISSLIRIIACLRYELAIPLPRSSKNAASLLIACLGIAAITSSMSALIFVVGKEQIIDWLNAPELAPYLIWIPVFTGLAGFYTAFSYWHTRNRRFGGIAVASVAGSVATAGGKLGAGLTGHVHGSSLILATVFGQFLTAVMLGISTWKQHGALIANSFRWIRIRRQLIRFKKFPMIDLWGAMLNNASWQVPPLLFAAFFSQTIVGYYALAFRFIQLPMSLIGHSLGQVFYPRIAAAQKNGEPLAPLVTIVFSRLFALGLLPAMLFATSGPDLFSVAFGSGWVESGVYAQILSVWVFWWFIASPLSMVFTALERQGLLLKYHIMIFITRLASIVIGSIQQDIHLALWLFSITGMLVYGMLALHALHLCRITFSAALKSVAYYLKVAVPLAVPVALISYGSSRSLYIVTASALVTLVYGALVMLRDKELYQLIFSKRR